MISLEELKATVGRVLQVDSRMDGMGRDDPLMGGMPEFDSMAVVTLLTAIEENYGIEIPDDEVSGEHFETLGSLQDFINAQLG